MNDKKFVVGQKVYVMSDKKKEPREYVVTKVGRKFVYVAYKVTENGTIYGELKFDLTNLVEAKEWGDPSRLYLSVQDALDKVERDSIITLLSRAFGWSGKYRKLSLETLRKIKELIESEVGSIENTSE